MTYPEYSKRLDYLKEKLNTGSVGSPQSIADRWGCSEKTVRNMINRLREDGLEIRYDRRLGKYFLSKY